MAVKDKKIALMKDGTIKKSRDDWDRIDEDRDDDSEEGDSFFGNV